MPSVANVSLSMLLLLQAPDIASGLLACKRLSAPMKFSHIPEIDGAFVSCAAVSSSCLVYCSDAHQRIGHNLSNHACDNADEEPN